MKHATCAVLRGLSPVASRVRCRRACRRRCSPAEVEAPLICAHLEVVKAVDHSHRTGSGLPTLDAVDRPGPLGGSSLKCPRCQVENREGRRFCSECGGPLPLACVSCGFVNESIEKFCGGCGKPLPQPALAESVTPRSDSAGRSTAEAERRQLTVMFCDLVGSTALSERLDPEELREVVRAYQKVSARVITRFEGHIAQYLGDGLLVYFGYPFAHEDDAQRAVRAGLGIVEAIATLHTPGVPTKGITLAVRLGIHTGLVVIGAMGGHERQEQLALGETPNLAARIQGLAAPNTVVISEATYRLVQGYFDYEALGEQTLRGVAEPLHVYRVLQDSGARGRLDVAQTRGLTPLVGRESEVTLLLERWEQAKAGQGQVVLLSGDAGIGRSRLVQMLKEHVANEPH